jgi:hypothetical protein
MNKKYKKLVLSIVLDIIGFFTVFPIDLAWAPISGYLMTRMYKGNLGKTAGVISFLEEIIPFSDVIPTFTIMWVYTYVIKKEEKKDEEITIIDI